jgi:hypothetical protein
MVAWMRETRSRVMRAKPLLDETASEMTRMCLWSDIPKAYTMLRRLSTENKTKFFLTILFA